MPSIDLFLHFGPRQSDGTYTVVSHWEDLRDVQRSFVLGKAAFDFTVLFDEGKGLEEYGRLLSEGAFGDEKIKSDFRSAYQAAGNLQADFRLRIAADVRCFSRG